MPARANLVANSRARGYIAGRFSPCLAHCAESPGGHLSKAENGLRIRHPWREADVCSFLCRCGAECGEKIERKEEKEENEESEEIEEIEKDKRRARRSRK